MKVAAVLGKDRGEFIALGAVLADAVDDNINDGKCAVFLAADDPVHGCWRCAIGMRDLGVNDGTRPHKCRDLHSSRRYRPSPAAFAIA